MHLATDIPKVEPKMFTAGETVKWERDDLSQHYPADESWVLTYYIRGPSSLDVLATADDDDFAITISATESGALIAGRYQLLGRVSKAGDVYPVYDGILDVAADPTAFAANVDVRTENKQILDALTATLKLTAGRREKSYSVSAVGRSFVYHTLEELIKAIDKYTALVNQEDDPNGVNNHVLIRFRRPL